MKSKKRIFIVAEAGINHNGEITLAKELIEAAKDAGADAIKFQIFNTELFYSKSHCGFSHTQSNIFSLMKSLEFNDEEWESIDDFAKKIGIKIFYTPFDDYSIEILKKLSPSIIKIASSDIDNFILLKKISSLKKPVILSTGMSTLADVKKAFNFLKEEGIKDISLLHCVSLYPTYPEEVNLLSIKKLKEEFNVRVGFSDHTEGFHITLAAVSLGAEIIEKHLTISKKLKGPDHSLSLEPNEFSLMVKAIRDIEASFGEKKKEPQKREKENIALSRRGLYAKRDISYGEIIDFSNTIPMRPAGEAIPAGEWERVYKKKIKKSIKKYAPLRWEDIDEA